MSMPDFLLIGAAKSGTTSIFQYLRQHPQIFMSKPKEPGFFAYEGQQVDFQGPGDERYNAEVITDYSAYQKIFDAAGPGQLRGEASVVHLYHPDAPGRIKAYLPNVKLIAILRNPADRALSAYIHMWRDGYERLSFAEALAAEEDRIAANWQHLWHYRNEGYYARQLQRYFDLFAAEQFLIFRHEELLTDIDRVLHDIFEFLEVDASFRPDTSFRHNVSSKTRSRLLHRLLVTRSWTKGVYHALAPAKMRKQVRERIIDWNRVPEKPDVSSDVMNALRAGYREDIIQLEELLQRDFSDWLQP